MTGRAVRIAAGALLLAAPPGSSLAGGEPPLRVAAFGTSLTARGGWQDPLRDALARCLARPVRVDTVALSGSTSDWGLAHVGDVVRAAPDIVLVEFYANDAAVNRFMGLAASRRNIASLFKELRAGLPRARLFGMGMNPIRGWRGWARPFLGDYIAAHRAAADELADGYVDFAPAWAQLSEDALDAAIPDGAHPDPAVAARIMVPELVRTLAASCSGSGAADGR